MMLLLLSSLVIMACDKDDNPIVIEDDTVNLDMTFKIEYGGEPLVMFNEYNYPSGETMTFSRFSFFLSDVGITYGDGQETLADVTYLDFTTQNSSLEGANEGITLNFELDANQFEDMNFTIGVNAENNAKTPADFSSSSDLGRDAEYWGPWGSYIFTRTEGQIDFGEPNMSQFSLHTGSDEARLDFSLDISSLEKGKDGEIEIIIDLKDYFEGDEIYDIRSNPQLHQLSQKPQVLELTNNLSTALKYRVI